MKAYSSFVKSLILGNIKDFTVKEIAKMVNKPEKSIYNWLKKHNIKKIRRYGDTELYMIQNFDVRNVKQFITDKSVNALRIKQCRLKAKDCKAVIN